MQLPTEERAFLLAYIERQEWLHQAVERDDGDFVKVLVEAGADVNVLNTDGKSTLALATSPELLCWLHRKGVPFVDPSIASLLKFTIKKCNSDSSKREEWLQVLLEIMPASALDDFCNLSSNQLEWLTGIGEMTPEMPGLLLTIASRMIEEKPAAVLLIAVKLLGTSNRKKEMMRFIDLIKSEVIKDPFIEQIVTHPDVLWCNAKNVDFFESLNECWRPSEKLAKLAEACGNLRLAILIQGLLDTTTLENAAKICINFRGFDSTTIAALDTSVKQLILDHIQSLQVREKSTIWHALEHRSVWLKDLCNLANLGFNFDWMDPIHQRTFLFTKEVKSFKYNDCPDEIKFNLQHTDAHGNNALEYYCLNTHKENAFWCMEALAKLGLKLSDQFTYADKCRAAFPANPYLQALLCACLLNPRKTFMDKVLHDLDYSKQFSHTIRSSPDLLKLLGKCIPSDPKPNQNLDSNNWHLKYFPEDVNMIKLHCDKIYYHQDTLALWASFWTEKVPSDVFQKVPESPLVSLVIAAIEQQHLQLIEGKITKPVSADLILHAFYWSHDDAVYFYRYLFNHPELMHLLVQNYMKFKHIDIRPGGSTQTTYAKFASRLISPFKDFLQLPEYEGGCPAMYKKMYRAFEKHVPPTPLETLPIEDNSQIRLLNRTVIVTTEAGCAAFKFLKEGEKYAYFAQEHSVCEAFHTIADQFKSEFIQPLGVYAVKQLPAAFRPFLDQLPGNEPAFVFHYKASPETFLYLQDLPAEKYAEGRIRSLHDAAKMVRMGIYPDLAALSHTQVGRKYIPLLDLMLKLQSSSSQFYAAGGGGSLKDPFDKTKYPNMRQTGLTDLRDATYLYGNYKNNPSSSAKDMNGFGNTDKGDIRYFHQMNGLSNVLLVDMVILAERYLNEGNLQWQNELMNERLGGELADGFAQVFSAYAEQNYEDCLHFTLLCGIDWVSAARQIAFWLDTGPEGYPAWVVQGKIPPGIYDEEIKVDVNVTEANNFSPSQGFRTNAGLDIGCETGPLALVEFEKAMYLTFSIVAMAEPLSPPPPPREDFFYFEDVW